MEKINRVGTEVPTVMQSVRRQRGQEDQKAQDSWKRLIFSYKYGFMTFSMNDNKQCYLDISLQQGKSHCFARDGKSHCKKKKKPKTKNITTYY